MFHFFLIFVLASWLDRMSLSALPVVAGEVSVFSLPIAETRTIPVPRRVTNSVGVATTARAAVVVDAKTGVPLYEKNADDALPLASITKLMTALVFLDAKPDWYARVMMMRDDFAPGGTDRLHPGDELTIKELFGLSLVASENNATMALARIAFCNPETAVADEGTRCLSDFISRMNVKARELHLDTATFVEPTGLDDENRASAKDVAWLLRAALSKNEIRNTVSEIETAYTIGEKTMYAPSTDDLVRTFLNKQPYRIVGGKTGSLDTHQYNLALQIGYEPGGDAIVVVLGSETPESRFQDAKALATWVFGNFLWP